MKFRFTFCILLALFSLSVNATLILKVKSTVDTNSNLEWLHLSETYAYTAVQIHNSFAEEAIFYGWRYATPMEFNDLIDSLGGTPNQPNGEDYRDWSEKNNGIAEFFFDYFNPNGSSIGAYGFIGEMYNHPQSTSPAQWVSLVYDNHYYFPKEAATMDSINTYRHPASMNYISGYTGHFLVRTTTVNEPNLIVIFGLGLIGLASRRFKKQ